MGPYKPFLAQPKQKNLQEEGITVERIDTSVEKCQALNRSELTKVKPTKLVNKEKLVAKQNRAGSPLLMAVRLENRLNSKQGLPIM